MSDHLSNYPPMPPEPAEASVPAEHTGAMTRREFMRLGALTVAGAYLGNKAFATYLNVRESNIWPKDDPSFNFLNGETYRGQAQIGIFLPGFGDMHSAEEAMLWRQTTKLPKGLLTGYVDYSNQGTDISTIVGLIKESVDMDRIKSVTMFGRSIGGLFSLPVAAELGKPVKSLVLCSSPDRLDHGDYGNFGRLVGSIPDNQEIATVGKWGVQTWRNLHDNGETIASAVKDGWDDTFTGANPVALQNELRTANGINIWDEQFDEKLRRVFIPGYSNVVYASTDNPPSDKTVLVVQSARGFVRRFDDLGIDCTVRGLPYDGHADVFVTAHKLQAWSQAAQAPQPLASK